MQVILTKLNLDDTQVTGKRQGLWSNRSSQKRPRKVPIKKSDTIFDTLDRLPAQARL